MPKSLAYHCAIKYDDKVVIHGGLQWPKQPNMDTFILNLGLNQWTHVPNKIPCGAPPVFVQKFPVNSTSRHDIPQPFYRTTCEIWNHHLIVATFESERNSSCTAALNLKTFHWQKVKDMRKPLLHGALIK